MQLSSNITPLVNIYICCAMISFHMHTDDTRYFVHAWDAWMFAWKYIDCTKDIFGEYHINERDMTIIKYLLQ